MYILIVNLLLYLLYKKYSKLDSKYVSTYNRNNIFVKELLRLNQY